MIQLREALAGNRLRARLLLQVHDELVLEVARDDIGAVAELVVRTMEAATDLNVPLEAEVRAGPRWDQMAELPRPAAVAAD